MSCVCSVLATRAGTLPPRARPREHRLVVVVTEEGSESHHVSRGAPMPAWGWVFTDVSREPLAVHRLDEERVGLDVLPDMRVGVWPVGDYTSYPVAGEEGVLLSARAAEANRERIAELTGIVEAIKEIPPDVILGTSGDPEGPGERTDREGRA